VSMYAVHRYVSSMENMARMGKHVDHVRVLCCLAPIFRDLYRLYSVCTLLYVPSLYTYIYLPTYGEGCFAASVWVQKSYMCV